MPCFNCPHTTCSTLADGQTYRAKTPLTKLDPSTGLLKPLCHNNTAKECDGFPLLRELGVVTTRQDKSNGMMEIEVEIIKGGLTMGRETIYGEDGPVEPMGKIAQGPFVGVDGYEVGQWHATPDGSGKPLAVQLNLHGSFYNVPGQREACEATIFVRLKSPEAVDELCRALIRSRKMVWPNEPVNVY